MSSHNMVECLQRLEKMGLSPGMIVDCGARFGAWTKLAKKVFPNANVLMVEAHPDTEPYLKDVCKVFHPLVEYQIALLGPRPQEGVPFIVTEKMGAGSSVLPELSNVPRNTVHLPMKMLDSVLYEHMVSEVDLLKLDVQGYELEILKGATEALKSVEVVLMETSLIAYNLNAPLFHEVCVFMKQCGFVLFDICDVARWHELTLFQMDVIFVREDSPLRQLVFNYSRYMQKGE